MADMIATWHAEHVQFAQLLVEFEKELSTFHEGGSPNYDLMHDIVFYLKHYGDRYHHPREDVAFERLVTRDPSMRTKVNRLLQEHRVIDGHGDELLDRLARATGDTMLPREALEAAAATYLVYYRHHLATEERDILPRAKALLEQSDWDAVAAAVPEIEDPLFGKHPQERFRELRLQIGREAS